MKKKITSLFLTAAFGLMGWLAASAASGDIYSINRCDEAGLDITTAATTADEPFAAGTELYFKVRLMATDSVSATLGSRWHLIYTGLGSDIVANALTPMQIGIYVSGRLEYATWVSEIEERDGCTGVIFKYVTKPGDFAMPIRLATGAGPAGDQRSDNAYYFNPLRSFWSYSFDKLTVNADETVTTNSVACTWTFKTADLIPTTLPHVEDYSLEQCGFYVKTIDFSDDAEDDTYWRTVHENSTITGGGSVPKLVADAAPEVETTLYVWSDDESAVKIKGGKTVNMQISSGPAVYRDVQVGTVTFKGGQTSQDFLIEGSVGGEGRTANIILSAYDHFNYSLASGDRLEDYLTARVKCIEPLPPSVVVECDRATAVASGEYTQYAAVLNVYLSQAYENPVDVTITPQFTDGSAADWKDYLRFSTMDTIDEPMADGSDAELPVVTIPANSTEKQTIYVFALRSDVHTLGSAKIKFQSSIEGQAEADEAIKVKGSKSINVTAETTRITAPEEGTKAVSTTCNDEYPFTIAVSDTYADTHDTATGYVIYVKYRSSDTYVKLDGQYYVGDGGALYRLDLTDPANPVKTTEQPVLKYTASGEDLVSQVYVVAPVNPNTANARKSEIRTFLADVKEARTVKVVSYDEDFAEEQRTFTEGDSAGFKITLSEKNETGETIYAYLKPSANADPAMFSAASYNCIIGMDNPEGLPINNSMQDVEGIITLLDGYAKPGLKVTFEVLLSTEQYWDGSDPDANKIKGYDSNYLTITINNVEPTIKRMEMNGVKATGDGYQFANKLPSGQTQRFTLYVDDPGTYDLTNTTKPFKVRWTAMTTTGDIYDDPLVIEGNPKENPFEYAFPDAGVWAVTAEVMDKDMDDWSEVTYTVYVTVLDQPAVEHSATEMTLLEKLSANDESLRQLDITVGYWDPKYTSGKLDIIVQVKSATPAGKTNPGYLAFDSGFRLSAAEAEQILTDLADPEHPYDAGSDYYRVELSRQRQRQPLAITEMDGTDNSSIYGFEVTSFVINDDVLPTSGAAANAYYLASTPTIVHINNLVPEMGAKTSIENTASNAWVVAGSTTRAIQWDVYYDVDRDFSETWTDGTGPGVKVTFAGCQNAAAEMEFFVTDRASGKFTPNFGNAQGLQIVTMTVEDKDGGTVTYTYYYMVEASKFLKTYATGPSGGTTTSALSQRYARMRNRGGLGAGHTFVSGGATFSSAENYELTWNCGKSVYVPAYAFGYKVANPIDNGDLDGKMDIQIDTTGRQNKDLSYTDYYDYTARDGADGRDSFFYLWILTTLDESGTPSDAILGGGAAPEQKGPPGIGRIPLPTNANEDGSYLDTIIEAIFAKEWREEDNLGDINQDGVPDAFAWTVWGNGQTLIEATSGVESLAGDLNDISAGNPDEDFIPGVWQAQGKLSIVNKELASYAPIGYAFNNRLELRGFHYGLNETAVADSAASFSADETKAWEAFAAANSLDPATPDLTKWSPEPRGVGDAFRMDPTLSDTDADGYPDGWEYFFWYQAKVWAPSYAAAAAAGNAPKDHLGKPRKGQTYVFERFNPPNILDGTEITAEEVLERFNPCIPLDTEADGFNPDFDNDGLADVEELLIGTNPCHWDTDGDRMCDAWEVMNSLDPLNGKKDGNSDGDFMAYSSLSGYWSVEVSPGLYMFDVDSFLTEYDPLTGEGDYEMQAVGDPLYADKKTYDESGIISTTTDAQNKDGDDNYPLFSVTTALGYQYYTIDGTADGAEPAVESLPVLVKDVTVEGALLAVAKVDAAGEPYLYGHAGDDGKWAVQMMDYLQPDSSYPLATGTILRHNRFVLVHDQVRKAFGFDPRTAWHSTERGYVANRWDPRFNNDLSALDTTGAAVDTAAYTDYDEYLVMRYRMDYGVAAVKWDDKSMWVNIGNYTTMPTISYAKTDIDALLNTTNAAGEAAITQDEATSLTATANIAEYLAQAFAQAGSDKTARIGHGADTDGDGVPDGWELYVARNPNAGPGDEEDGLSPKGARDYDYDGLTYSAEYAGTDSCNAYANCPSIYKNHPGNATGWFNKFFPTDPDDEDTDGDHISDGSEGAGWSGTFYNGGASYALGSFTKPGFTFIYGTPEDGATLTCIRGGGMNPCTVDTDKDAIPDLWEMQFAGVLVNASTRAYVGPAAGDTDVDIAAATFTADGLDAAGYTAPDVVYICGGMDATWPRDACSSSNGAAGWHALNGLTNDELLGTPRDMDFDHDGLQNFQEYLIQTVRHLRWDDATTPLMGRMSDGTTPGFVRMMQNAAQFADACIEAGYPESATNDFNAATWIELGYFGYPAHNWDMMIASMSFGDPQILLPPAGTAAPSVSSARARYTVDGCYIATDPRLADTDTDGMDDFYEMFHGLNPLLGTTTPRPMAAQMDTIWLAYGATPFTPCAFDNSWISLPAGATKAAADPILYPWAMGASEVDPDGDGLRNDQERITANLASPVTSHTDPTPLWFTDSSSTNSYVSQYYVMTAPAISLTPFLPPALPTGDPYSQAAPLGTPMGYMYSFEENEGYDTDNDWTADGRELVRTFRAPTDPLDFDDPFRRQALYLDGAQSWVQTREANMRGIDGVDFFKQFTVEAWVRPEKTGEQTILERSSLYGYDANNKDDGAVRANFRIGLTEDGIVYGMFDNDDAIESGRKEGVSCQTVFGPVLPLNAWSHVALTYDGKTLLLYVDGEIRGSAATSLVPANGVTMIMQDPGATNFPAGVYSAMPGAFFIGGRPAAAGNGGGMMFSTTTADYGYMNSAEWYQGYVDEVRIWDGARTSTEIAANWKRRMTKEDAATNRLEVYTHVLGPDADSSRNDNDGLKDLTAELVQLYDFSTLPGAVASADVAKTPAGFEVAVAGQLASAASVPGFTQNVGWWDACLTKSTVYSDYTVVPWVENTVHHLPLLDGSVVDSFLYNHEVGGLYQPADAVNLVKYAFANSAMPYASYVYGLDRYWRLAARTQLLHTDPANAAYIDLLARSDWDIRAEFVGTADLVPMGGAYAKTCPEMWDGNGVADAWDQTGADTDGDGLPDKWEEDNGLDPNSADDWAAMVSYNGTDIPAWEAYLRDLAKGWQPDGSFKDAYKSTADADGNGLLDWWQNIYALTTGASGDDDGDGLSNYVEYMLSEVFGLKGTGGEWLRFAPDNAYSVNPAVSDYFYRMNQLYVGEIFTDHDRVKDLWESEYLVKNDTVSPYLYDSDKDADGDGWSNYAEFQSGTSPVVLGSLSVDAVQMDEYPIPTIELKLAYHGRQNIGDAPVVVKAWSDQTLATIPDAVWTLGGQGEVAVFENGNSNVVTGVKYFGMNPMREMLLHFSPGSVVPGSVKFEFKDLSWVLVNTLTQQAYLSDPVTAIWEGGIIDQPRTEERAIGDIVSQDNVSVSLGTIDYATGEVKIDFSKFPADLAIVGDISGGSQGDNWLSVYNLQKSYVRVNWQSKLITGGNVTTYYLAEADRRDAANNSLGHAKQGPNTFIAFYDFDGDGMYTPGEPYGFARDVDVGWNYARVSIELTDTNVVVPRYKLTEGGTPSAEGGGTVLAVEAEGQGEATDREAMHIPGATDVYTISGGSVAPAKDNVRVRIARFAVDSMKYGALSADYMAVVYDRVLDLTADGHPTITEADILNHLGNEFDLDWNAPALDSKQKSLQSVIDSQLGKVLGDNKTKAAFTNVFYTVYIGEGNITARDDSNTNGNMLVKTIVRKFGRTRELPVPISGSTQINTTAPTFTWRNPDTTYTAFRITVSGNGVNWTSGYQLMPPRDQNGVCSWTAPLRVGAVVPGGTAVFANGGTYTWTISTYNSRWREDAFVSGGSFLVNVLENSQDYGTANVAVRYYGPGAVVSSGRPIRVQAFRTPDFSGEPVAEGRVTSTSAISSTSAIKTANAKILGLKAGSYYIRAFIDTDQNGSLSFWTDQADRRATWESWGCYCTRDSRTGTIFTPKSVTVGPGSGEGDIIPVFIEDCDTDQDSLPDAWEWTQNGNLTAYGAAQIDQNAGGFAMRKALTQTLTAKGSYSTGLAVMTMTNLQSPRVAALLLGVNATGTDSQVKSSLSSAGGDVSVEPLSVAITAIELDRESGTVKITTDTEGKQSGASAVTSEIYTIPSGAESLTLTCSVLHCDELGGTWKTIKTSKVKIDRTTTDYTFDLGGDVDLSSGFFKVKLEK